MVKQVDRYTDSGRLDPDAAPQRQYVAVTLAPRRSWIGAVVALILGLLIGIGVMYYAFNPFKQVEDKGSTPPPYEDRAVGAPGPDNTILRSQPPPAGLPSPPRKSESREGGR